MSSTHSESASIFPRLFIPKLLAGIGAVLVGIVVVALVAAGHFYLQQRASARALQAQSDLLFLAEAASRFRADHGRWPAGYDELVAPPTIRGVTYSKYIPRIPLDPWTGRPFLVSFDAKGIPTFTSLGSDQTPGGTGSAADFQGASGP